MTRSNAILLVIAAMACVGLSTGDGIVCDETKVGLTFKADTPLYYWTCKDANTEMMLTCPTGTGYMSNGRFTGCVSWRLWSCTSKETVPTCTGSCLGNLYPTENPQNYYQCAAAGIAAKKSCPEGTAFNPDPASNIAPAGCIDWAKWWMICPY